MNQDEKLDHLIEITARLDERHQAVAKDVAEMAQAVKGQSERIGKLENYKAAVGGWAGAVSFITSTVIGLAGFIFNRYDK